jgi:superfamily II DNA or RNA helicase
MTLRPYQQSFINNIIAKLRIHNRVVAQLATGGGKTVCFSAICDRFCAQSTQDILILVHREELMNQAARAMNQPAQKVVAGMKSIPSARVYIAMVETAYKRRHMFTNIGLVIIDECHIGNFTKVLDHFESFNPPPPKHGCEYLKEVTPYIIGFTATPLAVSKARPLKNYFYDIVCGIDIPELIEQGYLCPEMTYSSPHIVNRARLKMKAGEFDQAEMAAAFKEPKYIESTLNVYKQRSLGRKTIIFNCNVEHSQAVNAAFVAAGFNSRHLDADSPDRADVLEWFANTPDAILNNVFIATTGFDQPDIETVIVNKATASMPLWLQMCGRGARPHDVKIAFNIIDLGGNCITHGLWSSPRNWSNIFHYPKKPGEGVAPVKDCPECGALHHAAKKVCDSIPIGELFPCGYIFPVIVVKDIGLEEFIEIGKGIDIPKLIAANAHHKEYRSLFVLVERVFNSAVRIFKTITPEHLPKIEEKIHELARLWCKEKKRRFDQFHRNLVNSKLTQLCSSHTTQASTPSTPTLSSFPHSWKESEPANGRT